MSSRIRAESPEQEFWKWFRAHQILLFDFEKDQEHLFDQLDEYDVEMRAGAIVFESEGSKYFQKSKPLSGLGADFDAYFSPKK